MRLSSISIALTVLSAGTIAAPVHEAENAPGACTNPLQRKEWRTLSIMEQANYVLAAKCMMHKAGKLTSSIPGAITRHDDFIAEHQRVTPYVHFVGHFLPWHRLFLHAYETALREECFYFGALPYWDYTKDTASIADAPVFTGTINFGGDGAYDPDAPNLFNTTGGGCIETGIFAEEKVHLGRYEDTSKTSRCITRNISKVVGQVVLNPGREAAVFAQPTFEKMAVTLEGGVNFTTDIGVHGGGHLGLGGDQLDMYTSPSDPLFYLHHTNIDRIWAKWQAAAPEERTWAVGNPKRPRMDELPYVDSPALDGNVTLGMQLDLGGLGYEYKVGQMGHTKGKATEGVEAGPLCYEYI